MTRIFEEVQDVLPRIPLIMLIVVLAATDIFILACSFIEAVGTPIWMFFVSTIVFAAIIAFCLFIKLKIWIEDDVIRIKFLRSYSIPFGEFIDYKIGDIDIIRNYSGWGLKKITFKNFISIGYERGISLKVTGRRVITFTLSDPEAFAALLPPVEK